MIKKVHYKKGMGIFMLTCSIFVLATTAIIGVSVNTITGVMLFIISLLYLSNSAIDYSEDEIKMKGIVGNTVKSYSFKDDNIELKDGNIYVNDNKVRMAKYMLNAHELQALMDFVSTGEIV